MGTQLAIADLISSISKGELVLPEFQRGYVWNRDQVKEYLSSLYRGYPTGSFLIWRTPTLGIARGGTGGSGGGAFDLILDGQQRLTSVYALVTGEPPPFYEGEDLYFRICFNVKTEEFSYFKSAMKGLPEWLPVTEFLRSGLGAYLRSDSPVPEDTRKFLFDFFDRLERLDSIRKYMYYLDTLGEREMDEAVRIFNLVNKQGTPLTKADLALSHTCAQWPQAREEMRNLKKSHAAAGFDFDLSFYVRCASCVATGSALYEPLYKVTVDEIKAAWERARKALDYLLNILRGDAYLDGGTGLVSETALVPLVVYIANGDGKFLDDTEKRRFLHWFFAALMWNRYSGASETKLQQDMEALKSEEPTTRLLDNIIAERGRIKVEGRDLANASTRTAWSTLAYVVARHNMAMDWFNGQQLYNQHIGKSNGLHYHHIFPTSQLYKNNYDSNSSIDRLKVNEIANIAYLTAAANISVSNDLPITYLPKVQESFPGALAQQSVPENQALWDLSRFEDFLLDRRERLAAAINDFMEGLLKEPGVQQYSIADYIATGESETVEFKSSLRWDMKEERVNKALEKVVARTLAAFMNSAGGTLVVGVADNGEVLGLEKDFKSFGQHPDADGWEQALRNVLNAYLSKEIAALVEVTFGEVDSKVVAVVRADPFFRPVYLIDNDRAEFYIRSGNTTQQLDVKQANDYIKERFPAVA